MFPVCTTELSVGKKFMLITQGAEVERGNAFLLVQLFLALLKVFAQPVLNMNAPLSL